MAIKTARERERERESSEMELFLNQAKFIISFILHLVFISFIVEVLNRENQIKKMI